MPVQKNGMKKTTYCHKTTRLEKYQSGEDIVNQKCKLIPLVYIIVGIYLTDVGSLLVNDDYGIRRDPIRMMFSSIFYLVLGLLIIIGRRE